jgi:uncharacterized cupin superfamily protein/ribosomal protein S18 acetylase RimI-like enzyme
MTAIRGYRPEDHDAIVELSLRAWAPVFASVGEVLGEELHTLLHGRNWREHQARDVHRTLGDTATRIWVAEDECRVVGFVAAAVVDDARLIGEIGMVAVDPAAQGQGIGSSLTEHAMAWLQENGMRVAVIGTGGDPGHAPARRVYERLGFRLFPSAQYFRALPRPLPAPPTRGEPAHISDERKAHREAVNPPSITRPTFDESREHPGFRSRRARLGRQAGTERLGLSMFELPAGEAAYPYHWHLAEEELVVVLEGRPSLRTPDGWRVLEAGDVVSFAVGERGAHQLVNRTETAVRFLAFSGQQPDIAVFPDSGKVGAFERRPEGGGLYRIFRDADAVDYWEGEQPPPRDDEPDA